MVDDDVRASVMAVHRHDPDGGAAAAAWLEGLPTAVAALRRRWRLGPPRLLATGLAVVAAADRDDGTACVVKLALPGSEQPWREAYWLRRVAGARGAVVLLDADLEAGAQLLERIEPGTTLQEGLVACASGSGREFLAADDAACDVIAELAGRVLRAPRPGDEAVVPRLSTRVEALFEQERDAAPGGEPGSSLLPAPLVAAAAARARQLLAGAAAEANAEEVLLHGDLHHANVLLDARGGSSATGGWTVVDPHGVLGEAAYEVSCAVYNPFELGDLTATRAVPRCERLAAASGLPLERVRGWALVQAVLSAVWFLGAGADRAGADRAGAIRHVLAVAECLAG